MEDISLSYPGQLYSLSHSVQATVTLVAINLRLPVPNFVGHLSVQDMGQPGSFALRYCVTGSIREMTCWDQQESQLRGIDKDAKNRVANKCHQPCG